MCTNKIRIKNPSRRIDLSFSPQYIDVNCGKCKDCTTRKQNDWLVRSSAEFNRIKKTGGFCWFPTLTYSDEYLYRWTDPDNGFSCPAFDRSHFVAFRNKLRVYLNRAGYDFAGNNTIRYMYVTEYGGKKGRPHIHCLIFVPKFVPFVLFKQLVNKAWIYGMVRYSPTGYSLKSMKGVQYAMKYISKDVAWYREYDIDNYLYRLRSEIEDEQNMERKSYLQVKLKAFKRCLPHHCQSMGYGSTLEITDEQFIDDSISASSIGLYDCVFRYHVPMYYKRKYLYEFDKSLNLYTINKRGLEIARKRFPKLVHYLSMYLASKINPSYYDGFIPFMSDIEHVPSYDYFLKLQDYDLELIAKYMLSFRNVVMDRDIFNSFSDYSVNDVSEFINDNAVDFYINRLDVGDIEPLPESLFNSSDYLLHFNELSQFRDIEFGLQFIDNADKLISSYKVDAYYEDLYKSQIQYKDL